MWLLLHDEMMFMLINVMMSYAYKDFDSIFQIFFLLGGIRYTSHHTLSHIQLYFAFTFHSFYTYTHTHIRGK